MTGTEFINNDEFLRIHNVDEKNINYDSAPRDNNFKINGTPPPGQKVKGSFYLVDGVAINCDPEDPRRFKGSCVDCETKLSFNWEDPEIDPNAAIIQIQQIIEHLILKKL